MIRSVIYVVYEGYYNPPLSRLLDDYIMTTTRQPYANPTLTMFRRIYRLPLALAGKDCV